jgi:hypothetical protein
VSILLCMCVCMDEVIVFSDKVSRLGASLIYEDGRCVIHLSPGDECIILC